MKTRPRSVLMAVIASAAPSIALASCGAASCAINTNWTTESALSEAGKSFDLRYEYLNQDQPMSGTRKLYVGEIAAHHDEVSTLNRNLMASYSQNFGNGFGLTVSGLIGAKEHFHIHNHHGAKLEDRWDFTDLGDVRVVGRYAVPNISDPLKPASAGVTFGLKLPTGKFDLSNALGSKAERSMQPGTGTTDLIVGAFYHQKLTASDASWFVQTQYQRALNSRENFKPGAQLGLDFGVRKGLVGNLALLAQINYVNKSSDSGSEGEPDSSGARFLHASPGLSYALPRNMQLYAFYQIPLQRDVKGVQLTAKKALVFGLSGQL